MQRVVLSPEYKINIFDIIDSFFPKMLFDFKTMILKCLISWISLVTDVMTTIVMREFSYISDTRFAGVIPAVNTQWSTTNIVHCAVKCMLDSDCESFSFDGSTCYEFTSRLLTITPTTSNLQAIYYENKGVNVHMEKPMTIGLIGRNLAAGKPSSQNGLYGGHGLQGNYTANMANDDSRESEPNGNSGSCAHLGYSLTLQTMWWQVDLEAVYHVTHLVLIPRKDGFPGEMENIKASVGLTSSGVFTDCVTDTGPGFYGQIRTYPCPVPIKERFKPTNRNGVLLFLCLTSWFSNMTTLIST